MIKNRSRIVIKGLNQEKVINALSSKVPVFNYRRNGDNVSCFEVRFKDLKKTKTILNNHNIKIISYIHRGPINFILNALKCYGVMLGVLICLVLYTVQYNFVVKIDVFGVKSHLAADISDYANQILASKLKSEIDTFALEKELKARYQEISSVSVAIIGQTLIINVNEADVPEEMNGEFLPIISQYDGRIVKINLIQGTLAINEGDIVKKGDVLVYPYIYDSQGQKIASSPKAEIMADVWLIGSEVHHDKYLSTQRTGVSFEVREVFFNDLLLYTSSFSTKFDQYEVESYERSLTNNFIMPLKLKRTVFYQTKTIDVQENFSDVKEKIIENARQKALIFLEENEIIKEENYTIREGSGWHQVNYVVTLTKNIGG